MKTVMITGANVGIGFATARFIASLPDWHVILACRNASKASAAIESIHRDYPRSSVELMPVDLFSLASVRQLANTVASAGRPPLTALVLNAGGINMRAKGLEFTEDGFERTFQLNFLSHLLLVELLVGRMAPSSRIVYVSSDLHDPAATRMGRFQSPRYGPVEDLAYGTGTALNLRPMARYATAKLYAMMTAQELDRRLRSARSDASVPSVTVNSWSPGVVPTTQAGRDMPVVLKAIMTSSWFVRFMGSHLSTEGEAARALGRLVVSAELDGKSGLYFDGFEQILPSLESRDPEKARSVWEQSIALTRTHPRDPGSLTLEPPVPAGMDTA